MWRRTASAATLANRIDNRTRGNGCERGPSVAVPVVPHTCEQSWQISQSRFESGVSSSPTLSDPHRSHRRESLARDNKCSRHHIFEWSYARTIVLSIKRKLNAGTLTSPSFLRRPETVKTQTPAGTPYLDDIVLKQATAIPFGLYFLRKEAGAAERGRTRCTNTQSERTSEDGASSECLASRSDRRHRDAVPALRRQPMSQQLPLP